LTIETPAKNLPTIAYSGPTAAFARDYVDIWGNIKKAPIKTLEQAHGGDFIKVYVYAAEPGFFYGFQVKLRKLIYQKQANIKDAPEKTIDSALFAARRELVSIVNNYSKKLVELFLTFDKIVYNQPELF